MIEIISYVLANQAFSKVSNSCLFVRSLLYRYSFVEFNLQDQLLLYSLISLKIENILFFDRCRMK